MVVNDRYPTFPEFDPLWKEFEDLGMALGMHTFPSGGEAVTEAPAEYTPVNIVPRYAG